MAKQTCFFKARDVDKRSIKDQVSASIYLIEKEMLHFP